MGTCGSTLKCDACYVAGGGWYYEKEGNVTTKNVTCTGVLETDADIVGNGVLSAFLVSAILTCGAIVTGYFTDSLSESDWNAVDDKTVRWAKATYFGRVIFPRVGQLCRAALRLVFRTEAGSDASSLTRDERSKALLKFILVFSDQQLVTGLAMLIAGTANRCRISFYEFQVVTCLAWFSSTTHLGTLNVLKYYLIRHPTVRDWRVLGMVLTMILLIFALITVGLGGGTGPANDVSVNPLQCVYYYPGEFSPILVGFTIYMILDPYIRRMFSLYSRGAQQKEILYQDQRQNWQPRASGIETSSQDHDERPRDNRGEQQVSTQEEDFPGLSTRLHLRSLQRIFGTTESRQDLRRLYLQAAAEKVSPETRLNDHMKMMKSRPRSKKARAMGFNINHIRVYEESFLSKLPPMLFFLAYGLAQTILVRWKYAPAIGETAARMDFGQIVPVFLLALPLLAALEIYNEAKKDHQDDVDSLVQMPDEETTMEETDRIDGLPDLVSQSGDAAVTLSAANEHLQDQQSTRIRNSQPTMSRPNSAHTPNEIHKEAEQPEKAASAKLTDCGTVEQAAKLDKNATSAAFKYFTFNATNSLLSAISINVESTALTIIVLVVPLSVSVGIWATKIIGFKRDNEYYLQRVAELLEDQRQEDDGVQAQPGDSISHKSSSSDGKGDLGTTRTHTPEPLDETITERDGSNSDPQVTATRQDTEGDIGIVLPSRPSAK